MNSKFFTFSNSPTLVYILQRNFGCPAIRGKYNRDSIRLMVCVYVSKFRREQRTEFQCPLCGKVGAVEVFQPRLVIFRAEPSIDASIRTFVPSKCVSSLVPRQSSTNFSMTDPGAMNDHI